jgi:nicotinamidase-related amidase
MHNKQPQDRLQLSYTCVGNRWVGKGPRLCNMTHLYPNPEESISCVSHHPDDAYGQDCSSSSSGGLMGAAAGAGHCIAAAAEALAEHIRRFGCPEPVTAVQQVLWPQHCVRHTAGAQIHPDLQVSTTDLIVRKGWQPFIDAYSAFFDNGKLQDTGLAEQLRAEGIRRVVVTGVALDFCVLWTALDAVAEGFETVFVADASLPVSAAGGADAVQQMRAAGVKIVEKAHMLHTAANRMDEQ